jgi:hypothetical protein
MRNIIADIYKPEIIGLITDGYTLAEIKKHMDIKHGLIASLDTFHRKTRIWRKELEDAAEQARITAATKITIDHINICETSINKLYAQANKLMAKEKTIPLALACFREMGAIQDRHLRIMGLDKPLVSAEDILKKLCGNE